MAEFEQVRQQLRSIRSDCDEATSAIAAAQEKIKRLDRSIAEAQRVAAANDPNGGGRLDELRREKQLVEAVLKRHRDRYAGLLATEAGLVADFAVFTDPRQ